MNKYNSVVCSIGYISLLAILSYTHQFINNKLLILISILYLTSVVIFVIFEMIKISLNNTYRIMVINNLDKFRLNKIDKETLIIYNTKCYIICYKKFSDNQKKFFYPSACFGFASGLLIVISFLYKLLF